MNPCKFCNQNCQTIKHNINMCWKCYVIYIAGFDYGYDLCSKSIIDIVENSNDEISLCVKKKLKYPICNICNKSLEPGTGKFCEADCGRLFCSDDCAQLDHYESIFPNCCPGVYWCILCRNEYLDYAKGHLFTIKMQEPHQDIETYIGQDPTQPIFSSQCINCKMWKYEFESLTDISGRHQDVACSSWLSEITER